MTYDIAFQNMLKLPCTGTLFLNFEPAVVSSCIVVKYLAKCVNLELSREMSFITLQDVFAAFEQVVIYHRVCLR